MNSVQLIWSCHISSRFQFVSCFSCFVVVDVVVDKTPTTISRRVHLNIGQVAHLFHFSLLFTHTMELLDGLSSIPASTRAAGFLGIFLEETFVTWDVTSGHHVSQWNLKFHQFPRLQPLKDFAIVIV